VLAQAIRARARLLEHGREPAFPAVQTHGRSDLYRGGQLNCASCSASTPAKPWSAG
jgi:hypothetical protein